MYEPPTGIQNQQLGCWLMLNLGGSPALRFAPGRGQAVQGCASLPCCAPLPSVAPFPSLPHPAESAAAMGTSPNAPARLLPLPSPTRRSAQPSLRRAELRLLRLRSLHSAGLRYRKNRPRPAPYGRPAHPRSRAAQGLKKGPTPPVRSPQSGAGRRLKKPAARAVVFAFRPRRPKKKSKARFAEGFIGETPNPRIHAQAEKARSSASPSAALKRRLQAHKVPFGPAHWGPHGRPPNPLAGGI